MNPQDSHSTPFKGLMPYTEEDSQFFFGREDIRDLIIDNLQAWRLTLLYGVSGAGKSSVLHAGVVPTLRERGRQTMADNQRATPEFSVITFNSWSDDPVAGLAEAIQEHLKVLLNGTNQPLAEPPTLSAALDQWVTATDSELYIILDQFEDYFQYQGSKVGPGTFATELPRAVSRKNQRIKFLISIREEAMAKLDMFKGTLPNLFTHMLRVHPLNVGEARKAIEGPIRQYNTLAGALPVTIEPKLLEAVLQSVKRADSAADLPGTDPDSGKIDLTILQQVMIKLWDVEVGQNESSLLRLSTFERLGGAQNIVRTHFSSAMERLTPAEQKTAAGIFRHLVTPSGTKIAQTAADLADYSDLSQESVRLVLKKLTGSDIRILRAISAPHDQPGEVRYEIFHDVLSGPINEWSRGYEANERSERVRHEAMRDRELVRARYSRRIVRGLAVILIIISGLLIYVFTQTRKLQAARLTDALYRDAFRQSRRKETKREAIENFNKALAVYLKSKRPEDRAAATETYINIGEIHAEMGDMQGASENFQAALNRSNDDQFVKAGLLTSIGDACREVEPSDSDREVIRSMAAENYNEALKIYQNNANWRKEAAAVLVSLALVQIDMAHSSTAQKLEVEKAYSLIEKALDFYKEANDPSGQGFALFTLANAKAEGGYYDEGPEVHQEVVKYLEEALDQYALAKDARNQILVRKSLVRLHLAPQTREQTEKALAHLGAIAGLYDQLNDQAGRAATQAQIEGIHAINQTPTTRTKSPYAGVPSARIEPPR